MLALDSTMNNMARVTRVVASIWVKDISSSSIKDSLLSKDTRDSKQEDRGRTRILKDKLGSMYERKECQVMKKRTRC